MTSLKNIHIVARFDKAVIDMELAPGDLRNQDITDRLDNEVRQLLRLMAEASKEGAR